jgi:nucleoside-diphosphate kinase
MQQIRRTILTNNQNKLGRLFGGLITAILIILVIIKISTTISEHMNNNMQKTFAIIKPDAIAAKNSGKIIDLIEKNNFDILRIQKLTISKEQAEKFYAEHNQRGFFKDLVTFMTSGPVIIMVLAKNNAIQEWRDLMGATDPAQAESNTIRKLFGTDKGRNATHGSDSPEAAKREISQFFPELAN